MDKKAALEPKHHRAGLAPSDISREAGRATPSRGASFPRITAEGGRGRQGLIALMSTGGFLIAAATATAGTVPTKIEISTKNVQTHGAVKKTLRNKTTVVIEVTKQPNEVCSFDPQREESKPAPDAISQFLGGVIKFFAPASVSDPQGCVGKLPQTPDYPAAPQLSARLATLEALMGTALATAKAQRVDMEANIQFAAELASCKTKEGEPSAFCKSADAYRMALTNLTAKLAGAGAVMPTTEGLELQLSQIIEMLKESEKYAKADDKLFPNWLEAVTEKTSCLADTLRRLKDLREWIVSARDAALKVQQALARIDVSTVWILTLPPDSNSTVTGRLSCKNVLTEAASIPPVPISLTYADPPRLTATVGLVYSTLKRRKIGTEAKRIDDISFQTIVSEERAAYQLIPFTFLNVRMLSFSSADTPVTLSLGVGAGLNTSNGSKDVEYFLGASVGIGVIQVHVGCHRGKFAEPAGGYQIGTVVPNDKFPGVPVQRRDTHHLGVAVSYKLPI